MHWSVVSRPHTKDSEQLSTSAFIIKYEEPPVQGLVTFVTNSCNLGTCAFPHEIIHKLSLKGLNTFSQQLMSNIKESLYFLK